MADWQVGDLALCRKNYQRPDGAGRFIKAGDIFTVERVVPGIYWAQGYVGTGLKLSGIVPLRRGGNPSGCASARFFVKITPPEADAFDREVIDLMTGQPATVEP